MIDLPLVPGDTAEVVQASTPEKSSEEKTFAQITKRVGYDCDDLWKSLSDDNLNVDSRHMCRPANPLIVELVCMHGNGNMLVPRFVEDFALATYHFWMLAQQRKASKPWSLPHCSSTIRATTVRSPWES